MAAQHELRLSDDVEVELKPWIESRRKAEKWTNAQEMRTMLEKALQSHALRIATDAGADRSQIETVDLREAMGSRS